MTTTTPHDLIIGRIYEMRQSMKHAFNINITSEAAQYSSSNSSFTSTSTTSTSSKEKKKSRSHTRSCLLWEHTNDNCTVLLITTFKDTNPTINNQVANSLGMNKDELLKRLVAIHETTQIIGRPSIYFEQTPSINDILDIKKQSYLILSPVIVSRSIPWPQPTRTTFRCVDLLTINKLLTDLSREIIQLQEINLFKKEIEFYKKKKEEQLCTEEDKLASEKEVLQNKRTEIDKIKEEQEVLQNKRTEIDKIKEEQDQRILLLYKEERLDNDQEQHNDHNTSTQSTIPVPLIDLNMLQTQETRHDIFSSDDDEYMDNNQDSPVGTNIILHENIIIDQKFSLINTVEDWLHKNASWNDITIHDEQFI